jgi:hypothetical protein
MATTAYAGVQVTLTNADQNYRLIDLLTAVDSNIPQTCNELGLQAEADNAMEILIGDSAVSDTRYGYKLNAGDARTYGRNMQSVLLGSMYVRRGAGTAPKLNVEVMVG